MHIHKERYLSLSLTTGHGPRGPEILDRCLVASLTRFRRIQAGDTLIFIETSIGVENIY